MRGEVKIGKFQTRFILVSIAMVNLGFKRLV